MGDTNTPARVTLAWNASEGPGIAGYRLYEGVRSGTYTNIIDVGNVTLATVSNLTVGATYFFAVSAYDMLGLESLLSTEISYTAKPPAARLQVSVGPENLATLTGTGPAGYSYKLLTTPDLQNWLALTNFTLSTNGTWTYMITNTVGPNQKSFFRLLQTSP